MNALNTPSPESLLADPALVDPGPTLAVLRETSPVHWLPGLDAWLVTRHEDVRALLLDQRLTADPRVYEHYQPPAESAARWLGEMPFRSTSSDPNVLGRRLVAAALTPPAVTRMGRRIDEVVEQFAAPLRERTDVVDIVGEFTSPVARTVIGRILGIPPKGDDELRFRKLAHKATRGVNPILSEKQRLQAEHAIAEICEYVLDLVTKYRDGVVPSEEAQETLISDLVNASDTEVPATVDDIVRVVSGLVSAGTGTTSLAASRAIRTLLQNPEQLAELRADRSLLPNAMEELLRLHNGLVAMPRYVQEPFELRGKSFEKGQLIALSMVAANRDPSVFTDPDQLDIRRDTREAMAFGYGAHYCPGSNVARVELLSMLDAALDLIPPNAKLLEDQVRWSIRGIMSQIRALPVDFGS